MLCFQNLDLWAFFCKHHLRDEELEELMEEQGVLVLIGLGFLSGMINWIAAKEGYFALKQRNVPDISFLNVFIVFFIYLSSQIGFGVILLAVRYIVEGKWDVNYFRGGWSTLGAISFSLLAVLVFCAKSSDKIKALFKPGSLRECVEDVYLGMISWFICFPVVVFAAQVASYILDYKGIDRLVDQVAVSYLKEALSNPPLFFVSFIVIMTIVPFVEELLFRGFFQNWLRKHFSASYSIFFTSCLFAGFHFSFSQGPRNIEILAALFVLSSYLGMLYEKRGSIYAPVSLHMTFNMVSQLILILQEGGPRYE